AENALRAARIADMKKQIDVLTATKYGALCHLTHVKTGQSLQPDIRTMSSKTSKIIENLKKLIDVKNKMERACDDHCKKAVEAKESLMEQSPFDEFTAMPYHELKKCIEEMSKKVEEQRKETALRAEELLIKKNAFLATKKSLLAEIRTLALVERDAM
ncbi:hypothetical protein KR084_006111, partial [Drosophila pseudotakahashii]